NRSRPERSRRGTWSGTDRVARKDSRSEPTVASTAPSRETTLAGSPAASTTGLDQLRAIEVGWSQARGSRTSRCITAGHAANCPCSTNGAPPQSEEPCSNVARTNLTQEVTFAVPRYLAWKVSFGGGGRGLRRRCRGRPGPARAAGPGGRRGAGTPGSGPASGSRPAPGLRAAPGPPPHRNPPPAPGPPRGPPARNGP